MTLDEAIKRFTSNAEFERSHGNLQGCLEFRQLAEWLKELKENKDVLDNLRADIEKIVEYEMKVDKKWALGLEYSLQIIDKYQAERSE